MIPTSTGSSLLISATQSARAPNLYTHIQHGANGPFRKYLLLFMGWILSYIDRLSASRIRFFINRYSETRSFFIASRYTRVYIVLDPTARVRYKEDPDGLIADLLTMASETSDA